MLNCLSRLSLAVVALLIASAPLTAQPLSRIEVAKKAKAATVLVEATKITAIGGGRAGAAGRFGGRGAAGRRGAGALGNPLGRTRTTSTIGSAFCVHPAGLFLTNRSTVANAGKGTIYLTLNPGAKTQKVVAARIVRSDDKADLALLWAPAISDFPALKFGPAPKAQENIDVITCGFAGSTTARNAAAAFRNRSSASAIIKSGKAVVAGQPGGVPTLRLATDPGASGGPVLDHNANVIAAISIGKNNAGAMAVSSERLEQFLAAPVLLFSVPAVEPANRHKPLQFEARVVSILPGAKPAPVDADLVLKVGKQKERLFKMTLKDGVYRVSAIPVPAPKVAPKLNIAITFPEGRVQGRIAEQTVKLEGKTHDLSSISRIQNQAGKCVIILANGEKQVTKPSELPTVMVQLAGEPWPLNLQKATDVRITPPNPASQVACAVVITKKGKEFARTEETLTIGQAQSAANANSNNQLPDFLKANIDRMFQRYDANGDGKLSANEPLTAKLQREFQIMDKNKNGSVSRKEFEQHYAEYYGSRLNGTPTPPARPFGGFGNRQPANNPPPARGRKR